LRSLWICVEMKLQILFEHSDARQKRKDLVRTGKKLC
jgi:hypothetical protein